MASATRRRTLVRCALSTNLEVILVIASVLVGETDALAQPAPPQLTMDWPALAAKIVERIAPTPGEKVLLLCHPGKFEQMVPHLRYAVQKAGAVDLGCLDVLAEPVPAAWDLKVLERAVRPARDAFRRMLHDVDAAVMMPGAAPRHPAYAALQDLLREEGGHAAPCISTGTGEGHQA